MRACIIAAAILALAQPAFAAKANKTQHRHHASHHHVGKHHAAKHRAARHHHRHHMRVTRGPADEGYATPQTFARTESWQQNWFAPQSSYAEPVQRGRRVARERDGTLDAAIARHAAANGLPVELVHRVVIRESRYNPRARNGSNLGLMQIKHATARGVGYTGPASGLFDAETNLTYAVRYLAGAYQAAGGNQSRAVAYYASGYHGRGVRQPRVARTQWQQWQEQPVSLR